MTTNDEIDNALRRIQKRAEEIYRLKRENAEDTSLIANLEQPHNPAPLNEVEKLGVPF